MDETDVDSCSYYNIFNISQSQHRIVRVSKGSNKKPFAIKNQVVSILRFKDTAVLCPPITSEGFQKRNHFFLVVSLGDFLKIFDKKSKCLRVLLPKNTIENGSKMSKDDLFAHYCNDINEHPNRRLRLSFRFGNNSFSIKKIELHGNHFVLTEPVTLNHRHIYHFYKKRYYFANNCEIIENNYDV